MIKKELICWIGGGISGICTAFILKWFGFFSEGGIPGLGIIVAIAGILVAIISSELDQKNFRLLKKAMCSFFVVFLICTGCFAAYENRPSSVQPSAPAVETENVVPTLAPSEMPDMTPAPFEMTEKQSFASVKEIEIESANITTYEPTLAMETESYIYIDEQVSMYHNEDFSLSDAELTELVRERFYAAYHSTQNFSASQVNADPNLSKLILSADCIDIAIKQALTTNRLFDLPEYYDQLINIYEIATQSAPRGEYFLQLGRPYYEKALYTMRKTSDEKNEVFRLCGEAINAYRTSVIYQGGTEESDTDLLYRIAAIYHYLGDTPALPSEERVRLYRLAVAYLEFSDELSTAEDDYYGYISYYKGMVLHKLGVISSETLVANHYLTMAQEAYSKVYEQRQFNNSLMDDLVHALKDVEYRLG